MASVTVTKPGLGKLISLRGREWMVLPSADEDVLLVRPLGGSDDEVTGIYLPLAASEDRWEEAVFPEPGEDDINDFETARLLFDASRLSLRNVGSPRAVARHHVESLGRQGGAGHSVSLNDVHFLVKSNYFWFP